MAEFAHEILLIELPFGVGMIVFALFVLLVIRWLQKRQKSDNRLKNYIFDLIHMMLLATGFIGVIFVSHYIFSTFIFLTGVLFISCLLSFPILLVY